MKVRDGRTFYPAGWKIVAARPRERSEVALCPAHVAALLEWERRVLLRMAAEKRGRGVKDVP